MKLLKGDGPYLHTAGRRKMIDFTSGGIFTAILGNSPDLIRKAAEEVELASCYMAHHTNPWTLRYIDMLKEWTGFESVALFSAGTEATEAFWRACRTYSGKPGIWGGLADPDMVGHDTEAVADAMHGMTNGALVMAGSMTEPALGSAKFGGVPDYTGCMIMEPYHAPSAQFHRVDPTINRILAHQKEHDHIPLCVDEIQGGFGRTGKKWAHQWYEGLKPDFITIGKAAGNGAPLSALLGPKKIMESEDVLDHGHLHSTHSGWPLACAIGCHVIEEIENHDLISRSHNLGVYLKNQLDGCGVRFHAGRGLLAGFEFEDAKQADKVARVCQRSGLLVVPTHRKWVKIGPALTILEEDLETGINIIRDSIAEVMDV